MRYSLRVCDIDGCCESEKDCDWPIQELSVNYAASSSGVALTLTFYAAEPGNVSNGRSYTLSMQRRERDSDINVRFRQLGKLLVIGRDCSTKTSIAKRRMTSSSVVASSSTAPAVVGGPSTSTSEHQTEILKQFNLLGYRIRVFDMTVGDLLSSHIQEKIFHTFVFYEGPRGRSYRDITWCLNVVRWLEQNSKIPFNTHKEVWSRLQKRLAVQGELSTYEKEGHCPKNLLAAMRQMRKGRVISETIRQPTNPTVFVPNPDVEEFDDRPPLRATASPPHVQPKDSIKIFDRDFPCPPGTANSELIAMQEYRRDIDYDFSLPPTPTSASELPWSPVSPSRDQYFAFPPCLSPGTRKQTAPQRLQPQRTISTPVAPARKRVQVQLPTSPEHYDEY